MATHKQDHRPVGEVNPDMNEVPPEGIEPDLTPAPGTQPGLPEGQPVHQNTPQAGQSQSQSQPGQSQSQSQNDLGFDPDSPDAADPQVDPIGAAKIPDDAPGLQVKKRVNDDEYPPYNKG